MTPREHTLRAGVYMREARCTVCTVCGTLWWTPRPVAPETYSPRYCRGSDATIATTTIPLGVELDDAQDAAQIHFVGDDCPDQHIGLIEDLLAEMGQNSKPVETPATRNRPSGQDEA